MYISKFLWNRLAFLSRPFLALGFFTNIVHYANLYYHTISHIHGHTNYVYVHDIWENRTDLLAQLTNLAGECGTTKFTKNKGTKKVPWHWDDIHQTPFESVNTMIARAVVLAYSVFSKIFVIYTNASKWQLGAVITQDNRPIAIFSRKLNLAQTKYDIAKLELLSIVERLKQFNGTSFCHEVDIYTDHINLTRDVVGMKSNRVYRLWLLIK